MDVQLSIEVKVTWQATVMYCTGWRRMLC